MLQKESWKQKKASYWQQNPHNSLSSRRVPQDKGFKFKMTNEGSVRSTCFQWLGIIPKENSATEAKTRFRKAPVTGSSHWFFRYRGEIPNPGNAPEVLVSPKTESIRSQLHGVWTSSVPRHGPIRSQQATTADSQPDWSLLHLEACSDMYYTILYSPLPCNRQKTLSINAILV